jgi:hypothetical protein
MAEKEVASEQGTDRVVELEAGQAVTIRASDGEVEIRVEMTEAGPVLRANAAKLEIGGDEDVVIKGKHVSVAGSESVEVGSEGELKVTSVEHMRLRGEMIWLN